MNQAVGSDNQKEFATDFTDLVFRQIRGRPYYYCNLFD
jgi:hypothetical protein